jgi:hypothetical protein
MRGRPSASNDAERRRREVGVRRIGEEHAIVDRLPAHLAAIGEGPREDVAVDDDLDPLLAACVRARESVEAPAAPGRGVSSYGGDGRARRTARVDGRGPAAIS